MYLSRMYLNGRRRGAAKLLTSPQAMHAAVQAAFPPDALHASEGRALWRVDRARDRGVALLIVSPLEPDLTHIVEQAGWQTGEMWQTRTYVPLLDRLQAGQRWAFRLTANPVFHGRRSPDSPGDTKPLAHVTVEQQEKWMLDRADSWGIAIPDGPHGEADLRVSERATLRFSRGGTQVTIAVASFEGVLEVRHAPALVHALTHGVGRAKAYGCGLLTLAPLHSSDT